MLTQQYIQITVSHNQVKQLNKNGYQCSTGDIIDVNIDDMPRSSKLKISITCDKCGVTKKETPIISYFKFYKTKGYVCEKCKETFKICSICGSRNDVGFVTQTNTFLCNRHRAQLRRGEILKRTKYDDNYIQIDEINNCAYISIYDNNHECYAKAIIDIEEVDNVKHHKWSGVVNRKGDIYVNTRIDKKTIPLHRYLLSIDNSNEGMVVDHINHNTLDNRKENLRICTNQENLLNKSIINTNKSGVLGVRFDKQHNKWTSELKIKGNKCYLGVYDTKDEAIIARLLGEKELFKEFAPQKHLYYMIPNGIDLIAYIKHNTSKSKRGIKDHRVIDKITSVINLLNEE